MNLLALQVLFGSVLIFCEEVLVSADAPPPGSIPMKVFKNSAL